MNGRKGKSSLPIYGKHPELRGKYRKHAFWRRGCRADTAGENIRETEGSFDINRTRITLGNSPRWGIFNTVYGRQGTSGCMRRIALRAYKYPPAWPGDIYSSVGWNRQKRRHACRPRVRSSICREGTWRFAADMVFRLFYMAATFCFKKSKNNFAAGEKV